MKHANLSFFVPHAGCPHRCSFCDQRAISGSVCSVTPQQVRSQCEKALEHWRTTSRRGEIAFFGGSFTAIPREQMLSLLEAAAPFVDGETVTGIRCSTRPDGISPDILALLRSYRVTAVELGVQSLDNRVLVENSRGHTAEDVRSASALIREFGLELGHQMMPGLPGDSPQEVMQTARGIALMKPQTVRIYPTLVLRGTQLAQWYAQGRYVPLSLEETVELGSRLLEFFEGQGIRVIRLGLHASGEVEENLLAGPYHPALRELCESRRLFYRMKAALQELPQGNWEVLVPQRQLSMAIGQKRQNIERLGELGYRVQIRVQESPGAADIQIRPAAG